MHEAPRTVSGMRTSYSILAIAACDSSLEAAAFRYLSVRDFTQSHGMVQQGLSPVGHPVRLGSVPGAPRSQHSQDNQPHVLSNTIAAHLFNCIATSPDSYIAKFAPAPAASDPTSTNFLSSSCCHAREPGVGGGGGGGQLHSQVTIGGTPFDS